MSRFWVDNLRSEVSMLLVSLRGFFGVCVAPKLSNQKPPKWDTSCLGWHCIAKKKKEYNPAPVDLQTNVED